VIINVASASMATPPTVAMFYVIWTKELGGTHPRESRLISWRNIVERLKRKLSVITGPADLVVDLAAAIPVLRF